MLRFNLELFSTVVVSIIGLASILSGIAIGLTAVGIDKYVGAILGISTVMLLFVVFVKYYQCFLWYVRGLQVATLLMILFLVLSNKVREPFLLCFCVFFFTSKSIEPFWLYIRGWYCKNE